MFGFFKKREDDATALRLLLPLAEQGEASAQYNVGVMHDNGRGTEQDYASAVSWYRKAAEQGHVQAQFALGAKHYDGTLGVNQDYKEALEWFLKAAKQGHALARANLGMMYGNGLGVPRYHDIALMWLILAAETSEDEHRDQIVKWRETAAERMTPAQIAEAQRLAREWKTTNVNATSSPAIDRPFEDGLAAYKKGDYAMALRLWGPLADQGHARAQYHIGFSYLKGQGVPQDVVQGMAWFRKAGEQGDVSAQYLLGAMYYQGSQGVQKDAVAGAAWLRKAAEQGHAPAQQLLALAYYGGIGPGRQDFVQSYMWLTLAVSRYEASEKDIRDRALSFRDKLVALQMTPAQITDAEKLAREWKPQPER